MQVSIGQQLRQAREAQNISLEQAAQATRMRLRYLQALEAGDFGSLPSGAQARGFLRSYADYLHLDVAPLLAVLSGETDALMASFAESQSSRSKPLEQEKRAIPEKNSNEYSQSDKIFFEIGQRLRRQRELLGLSLEDVERHTRLRQHYLQALEDGRLLNLPSPVQGRGMLSNYAAFMGMDAEALLLRFAEGLQARLTIRQTGQTPLESERTAPADEPQRRPLPGFVRRLLSTDVLIGGALVIFLVVFMVWGAIRIFTLRNAQQPSATAPSIIEVLLATTAVPLQTISTEDETIRPATATPASAGQEEIVVIQATSMPGTLQPSSLSATPASVQVYVTVQQRAWMRATVDGKIEFEGRVMPGSAYSFAGNKQVEIITGNGAALQIFFNQQDYGVLGAFGQVVDVVFTVNGIITPTATTTFTPTATPRFSPTPSPTRAPATATVAP